MTKTKTILTALALTTALTAPVLVVPMLTAPPAIAGQAAVQDLSDLAAKVTPGGRQCRRDHEGRRRRRRRDADG